MGFTAFHACARGVEIAERDILQSGVAAIVREDLFKTKFGLSVGIDGRFAMIFGDGDFLRFTVGGGGGGKNKFIYSVAGHGVEKIDTTTNVGGVEEARLAHGFG